MNANEFEAHLSRQPIREVPGEWRGEILAAAVRELDERPSREGVPWWAWVVRWQPPARLGWLGMAAAWGLILALNHAARPEPLPPELRGVDPAGGRSTWEQHQRVLAQQLELVPAPASAEGAPGLGRRSALRFDLPLA